MLGDSVAHRSKLSLSSEAGSSLTLVFLEPCWHFKDDQTGCFPIDLSLPCLNLLMNIDYWLLLPIQDCYICYLARESMIIIGLISVGKSDRKIPSVKPLDYLHNIIMFVYFTTYIQNDFSFHCDLKWENILIRSWRYIKIYFVLLSQN